MATYLLIWNPAKGGDWKLGIQESIAKVKEQGYCDDEWSTGNNENIHPNDQVFLIKLGKEPRGIIASGEVTSHVRREPHWNPEEAKKGKTALTVDVRFYNILDPDINIFSRSRLKNDYAIMHWDSPSSGIIIPDDIAFKLEKDWKDFIKQHTTEKEFALITEENDQFYDPAESEFATKEGRELLPNMIDILLARNVHLC